MIFFHIQINIVVLIILANILLISTVIVVLITIRQNHHPSELDKVPSGKSQTTLFNKKRPEKITKNLFPSILQQKTFYYPEHSLGSGPASPRIYIYIMRTRAH